MTLLRLSCIVHVGIGLNAVSVGLRLSQVLPCLVDDIIGYVHIALCASQLVLCYQSRAKWTVIVTLISFGSIDPGRLIALRPLSLFSSLGLIDTLTSDRWHHLLRVYGLWKRVSILTCWILLVTAFFAWMLVLVVNICFEFQETKTWIFVKPWEHVDDFQYFDVSRYFGTSVASFLTFLQLISMDHYMSHIVRPIINVYPQLSMFFLSVVLIGSFGLLNVAVGLAVRENIVLSAANGDANSIGSEALLVQLNTQGLVNRLKRLQARLSSISNFENRIKLLRP